MALFSFWCSEVSLNFCSSHSTTYSVLSCASVCRSSVGALFLARCARQQRARRSRVRPKEDVPRTTAARALVPSVRSAPFCSSSCMLIKPEELLMNQYST